MTYYCIWDRLAKDADTYWVDAASHVESRRLVATSVPEASKPRMWMNLSVCRTMTRSRPLVRSTAVSTGLRQLSGNVMPKGPKGQKRPVDAIGAAVKVMQIATGEIEEDIGDGDQEDRCCRTPVRARDRFREGRGEARRGQITKSMCCRPSSMSGLRMIQMPSWRDLRETGGRFFDFDLTAAMIEGKTLTVHLDDGRHLDIIPHDSENFEGTVPLRK